MENEEDDYFQSLTEEERAAMEIVNDDCDRSEAIQRVLDGTPSYAEPDIGPTQSFTLCWGKPGMGFGEATFYFSNHENGEMKLYCDNECMSKEFIKEMLCTMVDNCTFTDI